MTEPIDTTTEDHTASGVSRRNMLFGVGAAAGAVAGTALLTGNVAHAGSAVPRTAVATRPEALTPATPGLNYMAIDAHAFVARTYQERYYDPLTGVGNSTATTGGFIYYPLTLPAGSSISRVDVAYQGQPILQIHRRQQPPATPVIDNIDISSPQLPASGNLPASPGGPFASSIIFKAPIVIEPGSSYVLAFFCPPGSTIYNATLGYTSGQTAFFPFTGSTPRVLDTRLANSGGKLAPETERTIDLGVTGFTSAVINLTITETVAAGFVAVFPADIAWPGNSSINWSSTNTDIANGVITKLDPTGKIKIRGGGNLTHVVIDRIGFFK